MFVMGTRCLISFVSEASSWETPFANTDEQLAVLDICLGHGDANGKLPRATLRISQSPGLNPSLPDVMLPLTSVFNKGKFNIYPYCVLPSSTQHGLKVIVGSWEPCQWSISSSS